MIKLTGEETKAVLLGICEENEIEADSKKTNKEIIELIKMHPDYEEVIIPDLPKLEDVPDDEVPGEVIDKNNVVLVKTTSKVEDIAQNNEDTVQVLVTDHDSSQNVEDDTAQRMYEGTWGNLYCEPRRERVPLGIPFYISRGMVKHLKSQKIPEFVKDSAGKEIARMKARFSVQALDGLSEDEFNELVARAKGK